MKTQLINEQERIEEVWHLIKDLSVRVKHDHNYLGIKKGQLGTIESIYHGQCLVKLNGIKRSITFCADEIERVK